jgi:hypothetical protein
MDIAPEHLISWSLRESLKGDLVSNGVSALKGLISSILDDDKQPAPKQEFKPQQRPEPFRMEQRQQSKGKGREFWEAKRSKNQNDDTQPHIRFGE